MTSNKKKLYKRKTFKYKGGNNSLNVVDNEKGDNNKEIADVAGNNVQKVATKINETITKLSKIITTKESVEYLFKILENNIDNNGKQTKDTLNYFNNNLVDTSINIIKFITYLVKQQIEKVIKHMDKKKGEINVNMNQYTKNFNEKIEEYTDKLVDTINETKEIVKTNNTITTDEPNKIAEQNGNKKKKTIKKSKR